jgi:CDP-glucose 4,6-dehydratase
MNGAFWKGKKVLLTGHTGFKGSWLVLLLRELGAEVTGLSLPPPAGRPSLCELAGIEAECRSELADIRDLRLVRQIAKEAKPSIILHLAAQALVRPSYEDPVETYGTNVMGTVHVLEAARHLDGLECVVVVTSDKCYENREWLWGYRENEAMGGHDPYSSSKGCAELVTSAFTQSFFTSPEGPAIASARAGNVIGGGDYAKDRLVPDLLRSFVDGEPAMIRNPLATRPWQHVLEPLFGYLCLAEKLVIGRKEFAEGWNFGPDGSSVWPVSRVADSLAKKWGSGASWRLAEGAQPHEAQSLGLDSTKARTRLGWQPLLDVDRSLDWIVSWTKRVMEGGDAREQCLTQIRRYLGGQGVTTSWPVRSHLSGPRERATL